MIAYIDDILILAESRNSLMNGVQALTYLLECVGFIINMKKLVLSSVQTIEFLGIQVNSVQMELSPIRQNEEDSCGSTEIGEGGCGLSPLPSVSIRENECYVMCHSPHPPLLPSPTNVPSRDTERQQSVL